jgi:hypothetical protein
MPLVYPKKGKEVNKYSELSSIIQVCEKHKLKNMIDPLIKKKLPDLFMIH